VDGSATSDLDADYRDDEPTLDFPAVPADPGEPAAPAAEPAREPTGAWPRISDYWPDAPHRMGPTADFYAGRTAPAAGSPAYPQQPTPARVISPPAEPRRLWLRVLLGALGAVVFLGGSALALVRLVSPPDTTTGDGVAAAPTRPEVTADARTEPPVSIAPAPSDTPASAPAATAAPLPFTSGTFELAGDVTELNLTVGDLGNDPFQVSTPDGSGIRPRPTVDGDTVKVTVTSDGSKGSGRLDVRLNERVEWALRMTGGVTTGTFALAGAKVRRIDLTGGAARLDMALPSQDDTIDIRMSGGVNTWRITTEREVAVKVQLRRGAGEVVLNGRRVRGIDRDSTLRADGSGEGRLDIDAVAGFGSLTVAAAD
jgi:hypothetical protein